MYNLLSNAIKFTPAGGKVWVHARAAGPSWSSRSATPELASPPSTRS